MNLNYNGCFFPQLLELIKLALAERKNMYHCTVVVHQNPARFGGPFAAARLGIAGLKRIFFDTVGNRFQLSFTGAGTDDEIVNVR